MSDTALLVLAGIPLLVGWIMALIEVAVRIDLSRGRRTLWVLILVLVPVVGLAAYALVRPYGHHTLSSVLHEGGDTAAVALVDAAEQHAWGDLDDDGFRAAVGR